jgi:hypothetical protein
VREAEAAADKGKRPSLEPCTCTSGIALRKGKVRETAPASRPSRTLTLSLSGCTRFSGRQRLEDAKPRVYGRRATIAGLLRRSSAESSARRLLAEGSGLTILGVLGPGTGKAGP